MVELKFELNEREVNEWGLHLESWIEQLWDVHPDEELVEMWDEFSMWNKLLEQAVEQGLWKFPTNPKCGCYQGRQRYLQGK